MKPVNLPLALIITFQMIFTSSMCIMAVLFTNTAKTKNNVGGTGGESFEHLPIATWILSQWNNSWIKPTLLLLFSIFWIGMHIGLKIIRYNPQFSQTSTKAIIITSYLGFSIVLAYFFAYAASELVCDPLIRLINHRNLNITTEMAPLSESSSLGPDWIRESNPPVQGQTECVAYTEYTEKGQRLVTVAGNASVFAFLIAITIAWIKPQHTSARYAMFQCALVVVLIGCGSQVVLNEDGWDWRVANSLLAAFGTSAFLAACAVGLEYCNEDSPWEKVAWIYIQLILACEDAAFSITENN